MAKNYGETTRGWKRRTCISTEPRTPTFCIGINTDTYRVGRERATDMHKGFEKMKRRLVEVAYIAARESTSYREGFFHSAISLILTDRAALVPAMRTAR